MNKLTSIKGHFGIFHDHEAALVIIENTKQFDDVGMVDAREVVSLLDEGLAFILRQNELDRHWIIVPKSASH